MVQWSSEPVNIRHRRGDLLMLHHDDCGNFIIKLVVSDVCECYPRNPQHYHTVELTPAPRIRALRSEFYVSSAWDVSATKLSSAADT